MSNNPLTVPGARVCVTGSEGYIGSATCRYFRQARPAWEFLDIDIKTGDDITTEETRRKIRDWGPDVVVNFAGISGERACKEDPERARAVNGVAPVVLRDSLPGDTLFIQASTCSLLDKHAGQSEYCRSKFEAEAGFKWNTLVPRFGTVFGAESSNIRWDLPLHRMVMDAVTKGKITIPEQTIYRPWTRVNSITAVLVRWITEFRYGAKYDHWQGPFVTTNLTLEQMAVLVSKVTKDTPVVRDPQNTDPRSYAAPVTDIVEGDDIADAFEALVLAALEEHLRS